MQVKVYVNREDQRVCTEKEMKDFWETAVTDLKTDKRTFDEWLDIDTEITPSQVWEAMTNNPTSKQIIENEWLQECKNRVKNELSEQWEEVILNT